MLERLLGDRLKGGTLTVIMPDNSRETIGSGEPEIVARIHDRAALLRLARSPRLGFGELYMDGRLSIEQGSFSTS